MSGETDRVKVLSGSGFSSGCESAPDVTLECATNGSSDSAEKGSAQPGSSTTIHKVS